MRNVLVYCKEADRWLQGRYGRNGPAGVLAMGDSQVKQEFPDMIFLAEVYNPDAYRSFLSQGNFDYLYDKVGLYDVLRDVALAIARLDITFALNGVGDIQHHMLNFIENHDEQRVASDFS